MPKFKIGTIVKCVMEHQDSYIIKLGRILAIDTQAYHSVPVTYTKDLHMDLPVFNGKVRVVDKDSQTYYRVQCLEYAREDGHEEPLGGYLVGVVAMDRHFIYVRPS